MGKFTLIFMASPDRVVDAENIEEASKFGEGLAEAMCSNGSVESLCGIIEGDLGGIPVDELDFKVTQTCPYHIPDAKTGICDMCGTFDGKI